MGNFGSVSDKNKNKIHVWYLNKDTKFDVSSSIMLRDLKAQLDKIDCSQKDILLDWVPVESKFDNITLQNIVQTHLATYPNTSGKETLLMVLNSVNSAQDSTLLESKKTSHTKLQNKLKKVQFIESGHTPNYEKGKNGHIVFQDRHTAIFASAISYALRNTNYNPQKMQTLLKTFDNKQPIQTNLSLIGRFFSYLGLMKQQSGNLLTSQNLTQVVQTIKSSTDFSDFDPKFVYYIAQIYLKFMIQSKCQIYYIDYKNIEDFGIEYISSKSKIGIIGDFGTGLQDSIELLSNMILKHDVNVIFHLGDVYYAGTPQEYLVGVAQPLKKLRIQAKKQIRFYSIPGNHDYYSWGLPFLCFVKSINEKEFHQQKASYFCVRDEKNKWQFLGMDTAFHDSNPLNQIYPFGVGPYVQEKELKWHKHRLQNFAGSTFLMTHHQLFSIHERINGQLTKYRKFSCINPMLSAQMFEHMCDISAWFWGHEHSLMMFKQNLLGLSKGRLLGNSSFHVMYGKEHPYARPKGFPNIPFIVQDEEYFDQYLPLNPNLVDQDYFGLSYAIIDLEKMDKETDNLPIEYWCSPSYSNEQHDKMNTLSAQEKAKLYFSEYKIYEEILSSRQTLRKHRMLVKNCSKVYLRCEIGFSLAVISCQKLKNAEIVEEKQSNQMNEKLSLSKKEIDKKRSQSLALNLSASAFEVEFIHDKPHQDHDDNELEFTLKLLTSDKQKQMYLGVVDGKVQLIELPSRQQLFIKNCIWVCSTLNSRKASELKCVYLFYGQPVKIYNKRLEMSLSWQIVYNQAYPSLEDMDHTVQESQAKGQTLQSLWVFDNHNLIKE